MEELRTPWIALEIFWPLSSLKCLGLLQIQRIWFNKKFDRWETRFISFIFFCLHFVSKCDIFWVKWLLLWKTGNVICLTCSPHPNQIFRPSNGSVIHIIKVHSYVLDLCQSYSRCILQLQTVLDSCQRGGHQKIHGNQ